MSYPYAPPSQYGFAVWTNSGQKRNGIHTVGDSVTIVMHQAGATSYYVNDYYGNQVTSGTIGAGVTSVPLTAPMGGWKPGWYRFYASGPTFDSNYGYSYCVAQFGFIRSNSNFPANADGSVTTNPQFSDAIIKGVLGIGPTRIDLSDVTTLVNPGQDDLPSAEQLADLQTTWWTPYADGVRERPLWCAFSGVTWDGITFNSSGGIYIRCMAADGTIDGSTVYVSVGPGSSSGNKITVYSPNNTTVVETYDNIATAGDAMTAINGVSSYIWVHYGNNTSQTGLTTAATKLGNTYKNGVIAVVQALVGHGVFYFEGPTNEPDLTSTGYVQDMKLFQSYVHQGDSRAKALGACAVQLDNAYLTAWSDFLAAGGDAYLDGVSTHAYNSSTTGDLNLVRSCLSAWFSLIGNYSSLAGLPVWQTESTGAQIVDYGTYHPRRARGELLDRLIWEQFGVPREQNTPWYDQAHGFYSIPRWCRSDNGVTPQAIMERVLAEETWGQVHSQKLDFGQWGNRIFLGSVYTGASGSTVVVMTGSALPGASVTFAVSGTSGTLNTCDCFGNTGTVSISAGSVVLDVSEVPTYLSLPAGATVQVTAVNDWGGLVLKNHAPQATATLGGSSAPEMNDGLWLSNYNQYAGNYPSGGGMRSSGTTVPDDAILSWPSAVTVDRVLIWSGNVWQKASTLLDFTVDTSSDGGSTWTTQETISNSSDAVSFNAGSGTDRCIQETYWDEQSIFDIPFTGGPVSCNALRIHCTAASYGGQPDSAAEAASTAWGAANSSQVITLQEVAAVTTGGSATGFVQSLGRVQNSGSITSGSGLSCTLTQSMTSGNGVIIGIKFGATTTIASVTDNHGNTYHKDVELASGPTASIWSCLNPTTPLSIGDTITVKPTSTQNFMGFCVDEYSGLAALDQIGTAHGGSGATSGTVTAGGATSQASEVAVAIMCGGQLGASWSVTSPFTLEDNDHNNTGSGPSIVLADHVLSSTGTPSAAFSWATPSGSSGWTAAIATYTAASASPPANTVAPVISGTTIVGDTLSSTTGTWSNSPTGYSYQWQRDNFGGGVYSTIVGATSSTYTLVSQDYGRDIRCVVTGSNSAGSSSANSNSLGLVDVPHNSIIVGIRRA